MGPWAAALPAVFVVFDGAWRTTAVFALIGLDLSFLAWSAATAAPYPAAARPP